MSWIDKNQYDPDEICPICYEKYGTTQGIYKTNCNHIFHNNCLNEYCEHNNGEIVCPICRADVGYTCTDVWAFKEQLLGNMNGDPLFDGNKDILDIYNNNQSLSQGGKRMKKTKRRISKNMISRKIRRKIRKIKIRRTKRKERK
jgi:hypothetical protein